VALLGVTGAVWGVARHAYLTEAVRPDLRARAMSTLGGLARVGSFAGPLLGSAAIRAVGLRGAYLVALTLIGLATVLLAFLPPVPHDLPVPGHGAQPALWAVIRDNRRTLLTLGFGALLVGALRASRQTILPLWGVALGIDPATIGLVYGISGAVDMLLFYPAGRLMDLRGRRWAAVPAMTLLGLAHTLLPMTGGLAGLVLAGLLMGVGNGLSAGLVMTVGADVSPTVGRAQFLGAWRVCADVGIGAAPALIGAVTAAASLTAAALAMGGVGLAAALLLHRWLRNLPGFVAPGDHAATDRQ
jgi:MFS family permease